MCARRNCKPWERQKLYVLHCILALGLHCTGKKSPPVLMPVFGSSPRPRKEKKVRLKCITRAVSRRDRDLQGRGLPWSTLSLSLLSILGRFSVLLCTVFCCLPSLTFFSLKSLKKKKWCFFPPILGLHFLIVKIFDGLLMNVFHSE